LQFESVSKSMYTHNSSGKWKSPIDKNYTRKDWDNNVPPQKYFDELFRISKDFIIWGANYFDLPPCKGLIVWDKVRPEEFSLSQGELAYTSINKRMAIFRYLWNGFQKAKPEERFHPTQKPVDLYKWILKNYAKEGMKIFDSHLGSGSIAIACHDYKFELTACEIDRDYYNAACKRYLEHSRQKQLF